MFKMTERLDPFAFFDHLAATSQTASEHDSIRSYDNILSATPSMETVKYEGRDEIMDGEAFLKKWIDFTRDYRIEKEALCKHLQDQFTALEEIDENFDKRHLDLYNGIVNSYKDISSNISKHKEHLYNENKQFEKETVLLKEIRKFQDEKVKLNVGGQLFETSLTTLRKDPNSMLAEMFDENREILPDPDDSYFIDRDGTYFRLILNYLRDSRIPSGVVEDPKVMDELMQEARFYKLKDLLKLKWKNLPVITQEDLFELYPLPLSSIDDFPSQPIIITLEKKDLSNLDFSNYHIDPRSSFRDSNLENCQFLDAKFSFDFDYQVDFTNTYLAGATFPGEDTENRVSGIQFQMEGAVTGDDSSLNF